MEGGGSGRGLFEENSLLFSRKDWGKLFKISVSIAYILVGAWTEYFPNTSH
jgi:hypothetical protein